MYVSGLRVGLTSGDLSAMPFQRLLAIVGEWNGMAAPPDPREDVRDATQADIRALMM